ncbi:hypothetical protein ABC304_02190 [Microbacterium sp. 1P10UB]|uniref:hypothetical protein n=1 Tax=unclassified Microbacterium TaxID=2609290 RepID=UPI00399F6C85
MDATSLPPALARELADLRRRAFGPDADIAADPDALKRLEELERLGHASAAPPEGATLPRPSAPSVAHSQSARRRPPRRRRISASALTAALVALVGAGVLAASGRSDDTSIVATAAERQRLVDRVDLARIDMIGARLQPFADFEKLWVWSATSAGSTCLLVGSGESDALRVECADTTAPVSVALRVGDQVRRALVGGLPQGSEVRFTMRDGAVTVAVQTADR